MEISPWGLMIFIGASKEMVNSLLAGMAGGTQVVS